MLSFDASNLKIETKNETEYNKKNYNYHVFEIV